MALYITDSCINCARCERACPVMAISLGEEIYEIEADTCVECVGYYSEPQCAAVCPKDCCIKFE